MSLARHIATEARLRTELNEALRERNSARSERDAARLVVAAQAEQAHADAQRIAYLESERDQADAAHRAALADLSEAHRQLADERAAALDPDLAEPPTAILPVEPDMDRCG